MNLTELFDEVGQAKIIFFSCVQQITLDQKKKCSLSKTPYIKKIRQLPKSN